MEQLSSCATTTEPSLYSQQAATTEPSLYSQQAATTEARVLQLVKSKHLEPKPWNKRSHRNEKPNTIARAEPPLTATRETPPAAMKTKHNQKQK